MDIAKILCMMQATRIAAEEIFMSQTKKELHAKIEFAKQCIEQDHSISDWDKELCKHFLDLIKKRIESERGW